MLQGDVENMRLLNATPLGVEALDGVFTRIIGRNTTIPTKKMPSVLDRGRQSEHGDHPNLAEMAADNKLISLPSPRQRAGRFRTRRECSAAGKMAPCIILTRIP